jgi:hypothetical protein
MVDHNSVEGAAEELAKADQAHQDAIREEIKRLEDRIEELKKQLK